MMESEEGMKVKVESLDLVDTVRPVTIWSLDADKMMHTLEVHMSSGQVINLGKSSGNVELIQLLGKKVKITTTVEVIE